MIYVVEYNSYLAKQQAEMRLKNRVKSESSLSNRKGESLDTLHKLESVMNKLKQSEENVNKYKEQKEHDFYLRRELRRLREEDFQKMKERQKRLEFTRKLEIIQKYVPIICYIFVRNSFVTFLNLLP